MNTKAMLELARHLEKMPEEQFDICFYGRSTKPNEKVTLENHCGTTCCIAGEKVLLDGGYLLTNIPIDEIFFHDSLGKPISVAKYAAKALDLTIEEQNKLFFNWDLTSPRRAAKQIRAMVKENNLKLEKLSTGLSET